MQTETLTGIPYGLSDDSLLVMSGETITREVLSSRGTEYYTVQVERNAASCGCQGWQYRNRCRHVKELRAELGLFSKHVEPLMPPLFDPKSNEFKEK